MTPADAQLIQLSDEQTDEYQLFTYSEEEQQENRINRETADLVFSPEFIPIYRAVEQKFKLTWVQSRIYGFIRFYLSTGENKRFYFTNEQIGKVIGCSAKTVSANLGHLLELKLISASYRIKAGGGKIRFITGIRLHTGEGVRLPARKVVGLPTRGVDNKNKIKENKIKHRGENSTGKKKGTSPITSKKIKAVATEITEHFNKTFNRRRKAKPLIKAPNNLLYWLDIYTVDEIKQAVTNWQKYNWWIPREKASLLTLFRRRQKNGEPCDYIGDLLNRQVSKLTNSPNLL